MASQDPATSGGAQARSTSRTDLTPLVTLAGLVVILGISALNMWNINRLAARVANLEAGAQRAAAPDPGPDPAKIYDIATAGASVKGPENAPITIVEFADFECPFCGRVTGTLDRIEKTYKGQVKFVWKHLPLSIHENAIPAALAAEAARKQGKFWEYHDKLFANQTRLESADLKQYSKDLNLDDAAFEKDMADAELKKRIEADVQEAEQLQVSVTPSFFINGRYVRGAQPFEVFTKVIDEELAKRNLPIPPKSPTE